MACGDCRKKQEKQRSVRRTLDSKLMATISEAVRIVQESNPALAKRMMELNAELNNVGVQERAVLAAQ